MLSQGLFPVLHLVRGEFLNLTPQLISLLPVVANKKCLFVNDFFKTMIFQN